MSDDEQRQQRRLAARVGELESEVRMLAQALDARETDEATPDDQSAVQRDVRWHCTKCGYLLAYYDMSNDVLRTRYKEHIVFMRAGIGGFVQIVCRGCSEVNTQEYVAPEDLPGATAD